MKILIYVHPTFSIDYDNVARRFVDTYKRFPAGTAHNLWVVCNGGNPSPQQKAIYDGLKPMFFVRDNTGFDIGAFIEASEAIVQAGLQCEFAMYCGANTHFKRAGWLARLEQSWNANGKGVYGVTASNEIRPHLNTSSFIAPPDLVAEYPYDVTCMEDRYHFEWGENSLIRIAMKRGMPVRLVTWDGEFPPEFFRSAPNGYRNGDQSGCLAYFRHSDTYDAADENERRSLASYADGLRSNSPEILALKHMIDSKY